jgi:para-aminobenzoate synthetase component 1
VKPVFSAEEVQKSPETGWLEQLCLISSHFERFSLLHTGTHAGAAPHRFDLLAGLDSIADFELNSGTPLETLDEFLEQHRGKFIFGHLNYELKDRIEPCLTSQHPATTSFSVAGFFVPKYVVRQENGCFEILNQLTGKVIPESEFLALFPTEKISFTKEDGTKQSTDLEIFEKQYFDATQKLFTHLQRGDIYEVNYCLPFSASGELKNPASTFLKMQTNQQAPFAALYRQKNAWLLCCSPERFLCKKSNQLLSQPIKGTAARDPEKGRDELQKTMLQSSEKERAENIMIVDLVRNDLGRIAERGSVKVDELCAIYSFPRVHQMISTVSSKLKKNIRFTDILKATFPMGSMTGAPKIRAMQIIDEQEQFRRGIYSGSVGYIDPNGDFDFNVVIRSIIADEQRNEIYFPAGSAITVHCDPKAEFNECLLKARGMQDALQE